MIERVEHDSAANTAINVNIALNYGGRDEIVHAARAIAKQCSEGTLDWKLINEHLFSETLYTAGQPDPDLIIRPSGEQRISNFLLWQSAYAESVSYTHLRAHETGRNLVCRLLLEKKKKKKRENHTK